MNTQLLKEKNYKLHSLIHWKVLVIILSQLNPDQQQWLRCFEVYKSATGLPLGPLGVKHSGPIPIADSHFHMDTLMARTGCSGFHELSCFYDSKLLLSVILAILYTENRIT